MGELTDQQAFAEVDAALRTEPLADLPPGFSATLRHRLSDLSPTAPRFRLTWLDIVLPIAAAMSLGTAGVLWAYLPDPLVAQFTARAKVVGVVLAQQLSLPALQPWVGLTALLVLSGAFLAAWLVVPTLSRSVEP